MGNAGVTVNYSSFKSPYKQSAARLARPADKDSAAAYGRVRTPRRNLSQIGRNGGRRVKLLLILIGRKLQAGQPSEIAGYHERDQHSDHVRRQMRS